MNKTLLASLVATSALFFSTSVFASGYSYNPPVTATHQPTGGYSPAPRPVYPVHAWVSPAERQFLDTMYTMNVEQLTLANIALQRSNDPRVRDYAMQVERDQNELENTLRNRAAQLGIRLFDRTSVSDTSLEYLRGSAFDVAYLERSMDSFDGVRRFFADFKGTVGGSYRQQLQCGFDELVQLREIAKPLHDDIRNRSRYENRDYGYNEYGNDRGYGRRGDNDHHGRRR